MPTEAAVATQDDAHVGPCLPEPLDQKLQDGAGVQGGIDVRRSQVGNQQMIAAQDIERQKAVAVVVAVEETIFLMTVHGIIGGIEVENEFCGRRGLRLDELLDENDSDVEQRSSPDAIFESAQRGRRGEFGKVVRTGMIGGGLPERIFA